MIGLAGLAGLAAAAVLGGPAPARHDPPQETIDPAVQRVEVRLVEVPVPTRDWATESVQMSVAAALGAILAARATAVRHRRRRPSRTGLIDITGVVQSETALAGDEGGDRAADKVGTPWMTSPASSRAFAGRGRVPPQTRPPATPPRGCTSRR